MKRAYASTDRCREPTVCAQVAIKGARKLHEQRVTGFQVPVPSFTIYQGAHQVYPTLREVPYTSA